MAFEKDTWGLGDLDQERLPRDFRLTDSSPPPVGRRTRQYREKAGGRKDAKAGAPDRAAEVQRRDDAVQDNQVSTAQIDPKDRDRARSILQIIGDKFAENRKKGKSTAYEEYQRDLAINMNYLVMGGVMNLKEISQTLMQIEEYRKQSSEHGKTPATLLAEWLSGADVGIP